ncbi:MAG: hypothetical protein ABMA64_00250 [Myxococcota bacterium]
MKRSLPAPILFQDDDDGFRTWVHENADGYVVNAPRGELPRESWLHRARCSTITAAKVALTKEYVKYCGPGRAILRDWARLRLGCKPSEGCTCLGSE